MSTFPANFDKTLSQSLIDNDLKDLFYKDFSKHNFVKNHNLVNKTKEQLKMTKLAVLLSFNLTITIVLSIILSPSLLYVAAFFFLSLLCFLIFFYSLVQPKIHRQIDELTTEKRNLYVRYIKKDRKNVLQMIHNDAIFREKITDQFNKKQLKDLNQKWSSEATLYNNLFDKAISDYSKETLNHDNHSSYWKDAEITSNTNLIFSTLILIIAFFSLIPITILNISSQNYQDPNAISLVEKTENFIKQYRNDHSSIPSKEQMKMFLSSQNNKMHIDIEKGFRNHTSFNSYKHGYYVRISHIDLDKLPNILLSWKQNQAKYIKVS